MNRGLKVAGLLMSVLILLSLFPGSGNAWGEEGHRYVNLVAAQKLPDDMPQFFRDAANRLSFLGPEPDRWRDSREL
ncbi:MAG TPA: nuclease, partial [Blastocatellia bacterium]|nr:nuclease [Blastocatellia bacterium]